MDAPATAASWQPPTHDPDQRYVHWPGYEEEGRFAELFHVAPRAARDMIAISGLDTVRRLYRHIERPEGVYVWRALEPALRWHERIERRYDWGPQDIWRIDGEGLVVRADPELSYGRWRDDEAWYIPQAVPADRLILLVAAELRSASRKPARAVA